MNNEKIYNISIIFFFILAIYLIYNKEFIIKNIHNITYIRCKYLKLNNATKKTLDKYNIKYSDKNNSSNSLYIPCGYNYAEIELKQLKNIYPNQRIYAINGCDNIASKNKLWQILCNYYGRYYASQLIPESYVINNKNDIELFKKNYDKNYRKDKLYILKKNIQKKKGILISNNLSEILSATDYKIIQEYVPNLFLLKNRKINLRLYFIAICHKNTKNGYLYKYGKCIYTNKPYKGTNINNLSLDDIREQHLTSVNLDVNIYNEYPETLNELEKYLGNYKYTKLWSNIVKLLGDVMKAIKHHIGNLDKLKKAYTFQIFGTDIVFTNDMKPYLLEFNKGADLSYKTNNDMIMKDKLIEDVFSLLDIIDKKSEHEFIKLI